MAFDCGIKYNIIRYFVQQHKVQFTVVPYDYDLKVRFPRTNPLTTLSLTSWAQGSSH